MGEGRARTYEARAHGIIHLEGFKMSELLLAFSLLAGLALILVGVAMVSVSLAYVIGGVGTMGLGILFFLDDGKD